MPLPIFEVSCVVVITLTLAVMARFRSPRELLVDYGALAVAGFVGEWSCVFFYEHYFYADGWHLRLDLVPLLVPLIWPLVILSARDVVGALWPTTGRWRPALVGLAVAFDASLVEVVAVEAGLWRWAEAGHLSVPLIGVLGWGFFAAGADVVLSTERRGRHLAAVAIAPIFAHALILATWWGGLRWVLRGDLGHTSVVVVALLGVLVAAPVALARRAGRAVPMSVAAPRMVAAGLFVTLLVTTAADSVPLWVHTGAVALPYVIATRFPTLGRTATPAPTR